MDTRLINSQTQQNDWTFNILFRLIKREECRAHIYLY